MPEFAEVNKLVGWMRERVIGWVPESVTSHRINFTALKDDPDRDSKIEQFFVGATLENVSQRGKFVAVAAFAVSLWLAVHHGDVYGTALVVSPSLWWDDEFPIRDTQKTPLPMSVARPKLWLDMGSGEGADAIKQLRKSPMDLDVYAWLVHRLFHLGRPSAVTWQQLSEQFGHAYSQLRQFRRFFLDSLERVKAVYPEARVTITDSGLLLLPSKPHLETRRATRAR